MKARVFRGFRSGGPCSWVWRCGDDRCLQIDASGWGFYPTQAAALAACLAHCETEHATPQQEVPC